MNEAFVLGLIGVVVAGVVLWPLLRPRQERASSRPTAATTGATARSGAAVSDELAELELDRAMGRVSEADYARWTSELDTGDADRALPNEPVDATARAEALVREWRESPRPSCPTCGKRPEAEARYCSNCGASLNA